MVFFHRFGLLASQAGQFFPAIARLSYFTCALTIVSLIDEKGAGCSWENLLMSLDIIINDLFAVKLNSSHFSRNIDFHLLLLDCFSRRSFHAVLRVILANALSSALKNRLANLCTLAVMSHTV